VLTEQEKVGKGVGEYVGAAVTIELIIKNPLPTHL
jgi:hypothetical protein